MRCDFVTTVKLRMKMRPYIYLAFFVWWCFTSGTVTAIRSDDVKFQLDNPEYPLTSQPQRILSPPTQLSVPEGDTVVFPCRVDKPVSDKFVLMWKRGKSKLLFAGPTPANNDKKFSLVDQTSLQIESVTSEYADEYTCYVNSKPPVELVHVLRILVPPKITLEPSDGHIIVKKGDTISAKCNADGYPAPIVTWRAMKGVLPGGVKEKQGNVLLFPSADTYHSGIYECKADNEVSHPDTAIVRIKVLYAPELSVTPTWVHAGLGSNVEFQCLASAEPSATLYWTRPPGTILTEDSYIAFQHAQRSLYEDMLILKIRRMTQDHFGSYSCFSNNSLGSTFRTVEISGLAEPVKFRGNTSGEDEGSFLLSWTVKSYSPIIEYLLRIRQQKSRDSGSQSPSWNEVMIPVEIQQSVLHSMSYNITGLTGATAYEAVIQARNDFGWNHPSETFTFYTLGGEPQKEEFVLDHTLENIIIPGEPLQKIKYTLVDSNSLADHTNFNILTVVLCICIIMLQ